MLELLSLVGGGLLRLLPSLLEFFSKGRDLKYELLRMEKEAELERMRSELRIGEIQAFTEMKTEDNWSAALKDALATQGQITGDRWLDRINVSVRPILTYWWCLFLYTTYKGILIYVALNEGVSLVGLANVIVTVFDYSVIGSIIGFWFVDRSLRSFTK